MCTPVLGAVIGGGQAVLGHIGQNQAASQRNKNRAALYNAEKVKVEREHAINLTNYYLRGVDAEHTWAENAIRASLAVQEQQATLNEAVAKAFIATEGDYVKLASDARVAKSLERSGKSAGRVGRAGLAAYGRSIAGRHAEIDRQRDKAKNYFARVQQQKEKSNREADLNIGFEPQRGPMPAKPVWDKGPGLFSLIANTALGAYGGYKIGKQLQGVPPGGGGVGGTSLNQGQYDKWFTSGTDLSPDDWLTRQGTPIGLNEVWNSDLPVSAGYNHEALLPRSNFINPFSWLRGAK